MMSKGKGGLERKIASGIMLTLLIISMLTLTFNIQLAKSEPTTIIVPDDYEKIQWAIGNASYGDTIFVRAGTYYEHVVVNKTVSLIGENRSITIIDGNGKMTVVCIKSISNVEIMGFTIQNGGDFPYCGIFIADGDNVIVSNNTIRNNAYGIELFFRSDGSNVFDNMIVNNSWAGIHIHEDSNKNTFHENTVAYNSIGVLIASSNAYFNIFYHNNLINNINQAFDFGNGTIWDDGYPCGGNYWSDYNGTDFYSGPHQNETGSDGIGDTPIRGDRYPLMDPWIPPPLIPGDINRDGIVDIYDVVTVALAFGSYLGRPRWNPIADLKPDGIIDIFDLVIIGVNFGKRW